MATYTLEQELAVARDLLESNGLMRARDRVGSIHRVIGLDSETIIPADGSGSITVTLQRKFHGQRIVVDENVGAFFQIQDIHVAGHSILLTKDRIPCSMFKPESQSGLLDLGICDQGKDIVVTLFNFDVAAHRFIGSIWGTIL